MEPSEKEALRKLPPEEVVYMTYEMTHDLHKDIVPRVERLEKWQIRVATAYSLATVGLGLWFGQVKGNLSEIAAKLSGHK